LIFCKKFDEEDFSQQICQGRLFQKLLHVDKPEMGKVSVISITPEQDVWRQ